MSRERENTSEYSISRRSFNKLALQTLGGFFIPQLPERISLLETFPEPEDPLLVKIVDINNPVSERFITEEIEPQLVLVKDSFKLESGLGAPVKSETIKLHNIMINDLSSLTNEMWRLGKGPYIGSGYRGFWEQNFAFEQAAGENVVAKIVTDEEGVRYSTSQHSLGLAIDFTSRSINNAIGIGAGFEDTKEGRWIEKNACEYGFVQPYINGHDGIVNESWHYLYVGRNISKFYESLKSEGWSGDIFDLQLLYRMRNTHRHLPRINRR